jgi:hypothetical protein
MAKRDDVACRFIVRDGKPVGDKDCGRQPGNAVQAFVTAGALPSIRRRHLDQHERSAKQARAQTLRGSLVWRGSKDANDPR